MATEIPNVRPAILSTETYELLSGYCRFRHVVRHIYSFQLDADQLEILVEMVSRTFTQTSTELVEFAQFLGVEQEKETDDHGSANYYPSE